MADKKIAKGWFCILSENTGEELKIKLDSVSSFSIIINDDEGEHGYLPKKGMARVNCGKEEYILFPRETDKFLAAMTEHYGEFPA